MQNKGFTLVELIVVITILAILGTIAFISLQGYGAEAKNSKVTSDLRNLVSAIETKRTRESISLSSLISGAGQTTTGANAVSGTVGSGVTIAAGNYNVWNIDFAALNQNGTDFKDPNNPAGEIDYLYAYTTGTNGTNTFSYYQLVGQIIENDIPRVRVNGTYVQQWTDVAGLVSRNGDTTPLSNEDSLGAGNNLY